MSEPISSVPDEVAEAEEPSTGTEAEAEEPSTDSEQETKVELDVDEEKMGAWDAIKSDFQVEPDADPQE